MATANNQQEAGYLAAYDQYADSIFRYCYYKTSNRELAKDLVQQVFFKTWSYIKEGNQVDNFRPFLYRLANNLIIDWYRRSKSDSLDRIMEDGYEPRSDKFDIDKEIEAKWALSVLTQLDKSDQDLITWCYVEDISIQEIAVMLGEKENNVSVKLHRALKKLKQLLNPQKEAEKM